MADEQERFWQGEFGDNYVERNNGNELIAAKIDMFSKSLNSADAISSVLELGANRGLNATALKALQPHVNYSGVEISSTAYKLLSENEHVDSAYHSSIYDFNSSQTFDLVFVAGVLIHLNPDRLHIAYDKLSKFSAKHVLIAEYFNPSPAAMDYRGHKDKLFKRDFAKEFMDESGFALLDYGFLYRHDPKFQHDDMNWFLFTKTQK